MFARPGILRSFPMLLALTTTLACGSGDGAGAEAPGASRADPPEAPMPAASDPDAPPRDGYRAAGNEPFWHLVLDDGTMALVRLGVEDTVRAARPRAERLEDGWLFAATAADAPYLVRIEERRCNDSMSGRPFPHTVEVTVDGRLLTGCGGDTEALLVGPEWRVVRLGATEPVDPAPTLRFEPEGVLSGSGGCNRFRADYEITGEGIAIGPAGATRMACADPGVGEREVRFFEMLERVTRFDVAEDGALVLLVLDEPVIRAHR